MEKEFEIFFNMVDGLSDEEIELKFNEYQEQNLIQEYVVKNHGKEAAVVFQEYLYRFSSLAANQKIDKDSIILKELFRRYGMIWETVDTSTHEWIENSDGSFTFHG